MKRSLVVLAMLFSLTACTGQQVQEAAGWTASAAVLAAVAVYEFKNDDCDARCRRNEQRNDALLQAAEERRTAQRVAELNTALDVYLTAEPDAGTEQRSVVFVPDDPAVPQPAIDRLDAVVAESED